MSKNKNAQNKYIGILIMNKSLELFTNFELNVC